MTENREPTNRPFHAATHVHEMSKAEIDQFLTVSPIGRLGMTTPDGPYIIPVGYCYAEGEILIHMCSNHEGRKNIALRAHPIVCFEVDESLSDATLAKSVIITGEAEIITEPKRMIPYLQLFINKFRIPEPYGVYATKNNREKLAIEKYGSPELEILSICRITPTEITGRSIVRTNSNF